MPSLWNSLCKNNEYRGYFTDIQDVSKKDLLKFKVVDTIVVFYSPNCFKLMHPYKPMIAHILIGEMRITSILLTK